MSPTKHQERKTNTLQKVPPIWTKSIAETPEESVGTVLTLSKPMRPINVGEHFASYVRINK